MTTAIILRIYLAAACRTVWCLFSLAVALCCTCGVFAQKVEREAVAFSPGRFSESTLRQLNERYSRLEAQLQRRSHKLLQRLQRQEEKLQQGLHRKDSSARDSLLPGITARYQSLQKQLSQPAAPAAAASFKEYIPGLDSLHTALQFLSRPGLVPAGVTARQLQQAQALSDRLGSLQSRFQQSADVSSFIRERQSALQASFEQLGLTRQLRSIGKEAYYYRQQVNEYKALLNNPDQLQARVLGLVRQLPAFQQFMQRNSYLSQLFGGGSGNAVAAAGLQGLQSREQVQDLLRQRMGVAATLASGSNTPGGGAGYLQQQVQQAQGQLDRLKARLQQAGGAGSDLDIPDFKPNGQKTKTFLQRLEYGFNLQSQRSSQLLPAATDIGFSVGYKWRDGLVTGIGGSYKLGWGQVFNHIRLSGQGIGLRSYVDVKCKDSWWITGGYEVHYLQGLRGVDSIGNLQRWQKRGLAGLTKKYKVGKKEGKLQLLWDFLSYRQVPLGQALQFRVGWGL